MVEIKVGYYYREAIVSTRTISKPTNALIRIVNIRNEESGLNKGYVFETIEGDIGMTANVFVHRSPLHQMLVEETLMNELVDYKERLKKEIEGILK